MTEIPAPVATLDPSDRWKRVVLPVLAGVLSLLTLVKAVTTANYWSMLVCLAGTGACLAFLLKWRVERVLLWAWIIGQFPVIAHTTVGTYDGREVPVRHPLVDGSQVVDFALGVSTSGSRGGWEVKVNVVPFAYLFLMRMLQASSLVGKRVRITWNGTGHQLESYFPITGLLTRTFDLAEERNWSVVRLDRPIKGATGTYQYLLVRDKENGGYTAGGDALVSYLRVAEDDLQLSTSRVAASYPFVGWGQVTVLNDN